MPTVDFVCFWCQGWNQQHQKQHTAGDQGRARDSNYPQVRPACWDSLGARWPHCQQAEPRLIKDVEPNWSYQHLLSLHLGGWRQSPARCAHKPSDLEMREILEDQRLQMKKVKGMNQNWKKKKSKWLKRHYKNVMSVWHQMDHTLSEHKYSRCTTVNPSSPLPFVHILLPLPGLNH